MKITIDLPQEYERHFNNDRFKDSLERLKADAGTFCMAGKYEIELCEMLITAFKNAEELKHGQWCTHCPTCGAKMNKEADTHRNT